MSKKPLIGIGPHLLDIKNKPKVVGTYRTYIDAVEKAGGTAVVLSPFPELAKTYVKLLDGLLLTGGGDIHPKFFGKKVPKAALDLSPEERTTFELKMAGEFLKAKKPILGICLGCQTINVALGGTLIQDLPSEKPGTHHHKNGNHHVTVISGTRLKKMVGKAKLHVNSRHHQAIQKLGKGLKVSAVSPDGVVEAVESTNGAFVFGIQWHPETIEARTHSKSIFKKFIKACKK